MCIMLNHKRFKKTNIYDSLWTHCCVPQMHNHLWTKRSFHFISFHFILSLCFWWENVPLALSGQETGRNKVVFFPSIKLEISPKWEGIKLNLLNCNIIVNTSRLDIDQSVILCLSSNDDKNYKNVPNVQTCLQNNVSMSIKDYSNS